MLDAMRLRSYVTIGRGVMTRLLHCNETQGVNNDGSQMDITKRNMGENDVEGQGVSSARHRYEGVDA